MFKKKRNLSFCVLLFFLIFFQKNLAKTHFLRFSLTPIFDFSKTDSPLQTRPVVHFATATGLWYDFPIFDFFYLQTGLLYQYNQGGFKVNSNELGYFYEKEQIFTQHEKANTQLLQRNFHNQYLLWPLGLRFRSKDWGVWSIFVQGGFLQFFLLKTKAEDQVILKNYPDLGPIFLHNLSIDTFFKKYHLAAYIQAGANFSLLNRLDFSIALGYYGTLYNVYKEGYFISKPDLFWTLHGLGLELGLQVKLGALD